jgi:hypothetical protein
VTDLWTPGKAGPQDELVVRIHRQIARFAGERQIEQPVVEVELRGGSRFELEALLPEPGYGFVTIRTHTGDDDVPAELIVPIGLIERIELYAAQDKPSAFGFSAPETDAPN